MDNRPVIFIVDDNDVIGSLVASLLMHESRVVRTFQDSESALAAFNEADPKPSLLITDFKMPGMNGMELIQRCKQLRPDLRTISISGNLPLDLCRHYAIQPDRCIPKPFNIETMTTTVGEMLANTSSPRADDRPSDSRAAPVAGRDDPKLQTE